MKNLVVIPIKRINLSKQRLSTILSREERIRLSLYMLLDVLDVLYRSKNVDTIALLTIKKTQNVLFHLPLEDVSIIEDHGASLNDSIKIAAKWATKHKFSRMMILPLDIPLIKSYDIETTFIKSESLSQGIVISPSYNNGTNLLILTPPNVMPTFYGENSYYKHVSYALEHNLDVIEYYNDRISTDLDTPLDVLVFMEKGYNTKTHYYLQSIGLYERFSLILQRF